VFVRDLYRIRSDSPVQLTEERFDAHRVFACGVVEGMIRRDVAANALKPVLGKDGDSLRMALYDILNQAISGDTGGNLPVCHGSLHSALSNVARG
jgi:hypothetical protein